MKDWLYIFKTEWKVASLTGILTIFSIFFESFGFGLIFPLMQGILGQENNGFFYEAITMALGHFGMTPDLKAIVIILCLMVFLKTILTIMREVMKSFLGYNFKQKTIARINQYLFAKPYSHIIKEQHGVWFNRIVIETQSTGQGLIQFVEVIISIIYIIMLSAVLMITDPSLTSKSIALAAGFFIIIYLVMSRYAKRTGITEVTLNQEMNAQISENISLNKEYRIAQSTHHAYGNVKKSAIKLRNLLVTWDGISGSVAPLIELFLIISFCIIILVASAQSPDQLQQLVSTLAVFAVVGLRMLQRSARLSSSIMAVRKYSASLKIILPFITDDLKSSQTVKTFPGGDIGCHGLTIFDRDGNTILDQVDLEIKENNIVAIVGPSGSGKTSLIETIVGLRDIHAGDVTYSDVSINTLNPSDILSNFSIVSQNIDLFNVSLRDNIQGKLNLNDDDIEKLGQTLRLDHFVDQLDNGYDTIVGERGNMLSGGQKQRVLFARALSYDDPYLVLDEPTSALDADLEQHIFSLIEAMKGQKTIIFITHRPKLLELADDIYEIKDKRVVKKG